jgi:hypothetical protein
MRILFPDENMFDIDVGIPMKRNFPTKVIVWLGACSKEVTLFVIFREEIVDYARYIKEVLTVAFKCENDVYGIDWIFQQDRAKSHNHHLTQKWRGDYFPAFLDQHRWPNNSPESNPLDDCI